jgi:hypothetical protein
MVISASRSGRAQIGRLLLLVFLMLAGVAGKLSGQNNSSSNSNKDRPSEVAPAKRSPGAEYSGMYSFLKDGEFVQVSVEEQGRVTGFVSRYGDSESDRGSFLEHFFKEGKLDGNQLTFSTDAVHGMSFDFRGTVERGAGVNPGDEEYYVLKGTLVEKRTDEVKKTSSRSLEVALKSFPRDLASPEAEKK